MTSAKNAAGVELDAATARGLAMLALRPLSAALDAFYAMTMSLKTFAALTITLAIAGITHAAEPAPSSPPPVPYEDHGACPFECCTYRTWRAKADTQILRNRRDGAAPAFRVRVGDQVEGITGVVVTTRFGRATIRMPMPIVAESGTVQLRPGDAVYIVRYAGEGFWKAWVRGRFLEIELADQGETCRGDDGGPGPCAAEIVEKPDTVWWAKIRNRAGKEGWTRQLDHFAKIDACG